MQNPRSPKNNTKPTKQNTTCQRPEGKKNPTQPKKTQPKKCYLSWKEDHIPLQNNPAIQILALELVVKNLISLYTHRSSNVIGFPLIGFPLNTIPICTGFSFLTVE